MSEWKKILITAVTCLIGGLLVGLLLRGCGKGIDPQPIIIHDSITVTDTAYIIKHTKPKEVVKWDTCYMPTVDSGNHFVDTNKMVEVQVPITAYEYHDTIKTDSSNIELGVHFSGYRAKIDSVNLNYRFEVQPVIVEKKKDWRFAVMPSIQIGYGVAFGSPVITAPYVGIGISVGWGYTFKK